MKYIAFCGPKELGSILSSDIVPVKLPCDADGKIKPSRRATIILEPNGNAYISPQGCNICGNRCDLYTVTDNS